MSFSLHICFCTHCIVDGVIGLFEYLVAFEVLAVKFEVSAQLSLLITFLMTDLIQLHSAETNQNYITIKILILVHNGIGV